MFFGLVSTAEPVIVPSLSAVAVVLVFEAVVPLEEKVPDRFNSCECGEDIVKL